MDPGEKNVNAISSIAFQQTALLGSPEDNRGYDKAQAFVVRLQRSGSRSEDRLVGLLSTIFVSNLTPIEKKTVLSQDYNVPVDEHMERMVANMCNYSSYVLNKGIQQGIQQGMQQGIQQTAVSNIRSLMANLNLTPKQAMDALSIPAADQPKYVEMLSS